MVSFEITRAFYYYKDYLNSLVWRQMPRFGYPDQYTQNLDFLFSVTFFFFMIKTC